MQTALIILTILIILFTISIYFLRYLDGHYTIVSSEIIKNGVITSNGKNIGNYFIIKTIYQNGRIVIKEINM